MGALRSCSSDDLLWTCVAAGLKGFWFLLREGFLRLCLKPALLFERNSQLSVVGLHPLLRLLDVPCGEVESGDRDPNDAKRAPSERRWPKEFQQPGPPNSFRIAGIRLKYLSLPFGWDVPKRLRFQFFF